MAGAFSSITFFNFNTSSLSAASGSTKISVEALEQTSKKVTAERLDRC